MQEDTKIVLPPQNTFTKIQKSKNDDPKSFSIIELKTPYRGLDKLRLEHVVRTGPKEEKRNLRYLGNGIGLVKRATDLDKKDQQHPDFAVKIMKDKKAAENEFRANILLDRDVTWGTMNNKFYVVIPWIDGINYNEYCKQLKEYFRTGKPMTAPLYSITQRILMLIGYLLQVKVLHDLGLILGDPKSSNCMLDSKGNLILIDLDAVHFPNETGWGRTTRYLSPNLINQKKISSKYTAKDDIFIFGHMFAELFPEFFNIKFDEHDQKAAELSYVKISHETPTERMLAKLISLMMFPAPFMRPLVDKCIEQLRTITEHSQRDIPTGISKSKDNDSKTIIDKPAVNIQWSEYIQQLCHLVNEDKSTPYYTINQRLEIFRLYLLQVQEIHDQGIYILDPNIHCIFDCKLGALLNSESKSLDRNFKRYHLPPDLIALPSKKITTQYEQSDDIYIIGHMLAEFFPEFFIVIYDPSGQESPEINASKNSHRYKDFNTYKFLTKLILSMTDDDLSLRPSVSSCIKKLKVIGTQANIDFTLSADEQKIKVADAKKTPNPLDECMLAMEKIIKTNTSKEEKISLLKELCTIWLMKSPDNSEKIQNLYINYLFKISNTPTVKQGYRFHQEIQRGKPLPKKTHEIKDSNKPGHR